MNNKHSPTYGSFQIVRRLSNRKQAILPNNVIVYKTDKLFVPEYNGFIPLMDYGDGHFIYEIPVRYAKLYPGPIYRCTCGAAAIITGNSGYMYGASPQGLMFVCNHHSNYGQHATGGDRWI